MRRLREMVAEFENDNEIDYLIGACQEMIPKMSEYQEYVDFLESLKETDVPPKPEWCPYCGALGELERLQEIGECRCLACGVIFTPSRIREE